MDTLVAFVLYVAFFRVAIILAGVTSILLGYLLFLRGVFPTSDAKRHEDKIEARAAGASLTLKNAAPGTAFAAFGALIIVSMLVTGRPEATLELLERGGSKIRAEVRGDDIGSARSDSDRALSLLRQGNKQRAADLADRALRELAAPLNDFAWVLLKSDSDPAQARQIAMAAVSIQPMEPNFLHTLAEIQFTTGEREQAIRTLERAQAIDPRFTRQLEEWRGGIPRKKG